MEVERDRRPLIWVESDTYCQFSRRHSGLELSRTWLRASVC